MEEKIKEIRVQIDAAFQLTGMLRSSREVALAKTHFQEAKMSLGKVLGYIGAANPYPESKNPNSPVIEKTADTAINTKLPHQDIVANIKAVRQLADTISHSLEILVLPADRSDKCQLFYEDCFLQVNKGMMWLGMDLGRIRDEEEAAKK